MSVDVSSIILHGPRNITVYSRSTVSFHCTSDGLSDIYWKYSEATGHSVYVFAHRGRNEEQFDERFVKTVNGSTSILIIRDVQTSDAGLYSCRENKSDIRQWPARLTVIG